MHVHAKGLALCGLLGALLTPATPTAVAEGPPRGAWYLALDAEPFGLPPGTNLAGLATFHNNKSFTIVDGGDFGGAPFDTRHTAQVGSWRRKDGNIVAVSLFIQADAATGEVQSWQRVQFTLRKDGPGRLSGTVNVFELQCDGPAPFPVFGCPDPIAAATDFTLVPPADIPVTLRRLPARPAEPE